MIAFAKNTTNLMLQLPESFSHEFYCLADYIIPVFHITLPLKSLSRIWWKSAILTRFPDVKVAKAENRLFGFTWL